MKKKIGIISSLDALSLLALRDTFLDDDIEIKYVIRTSLSVKSKIKLMTQAFYKKSLFFLVYLYLEIMIAAIKGRGLDKEALPEIIDINESKLNQLSTNNKVDLLLSVRPGCILRQPFINSFPLIVNLHLTKLPQNRGIGGILHTMLQEKSLWATLHTIHSEKVDKGLIVEQLEISQIEFGSVFENTIHAYNKSSPFIAKTLGAENFTFSTPTGGNYNSWPGKEVLEEMKVKGLKFFSLSDITRNKISL